MPGRHRSAFQDSLDQSRDAQAMTTRCAVKGCRWRYEGTAGNGRVMAKRHRAECHPDLPVEPPRKKGSRLPPREPPPRLETISNPPPSAANGHRPRRRANRRITEPRASAAADAYRAGWTLRAIADHVWTAWGFASEASCKNSLPEALADQGVTMRRRGATVDRLMTTGEFAALVRAAG